MLVLCSTCNRHVKSVPCPFCGGNTTSATRALPTRRLSRTQLLAGAALVSVAAGCGSDEPTPEPEADGGLSSSGTSAQPVYGAPIPDDAGLDQDSGESSSGGAAALYGSPPDGSL